MRAVDGWDEAVDLIDEDDVKRGNADPSYGRYRGVLTDTGTACNHRRTC